MPSRNSTVIQFAVDIKDLINDKLKEINLEVTEMHKNRRTPNPAEASIMDLQKMQYVDSKYFLSAYKVLKQVTFFQLPEKAVLGFTATEGADKMEDAIRYGPY